MPEPVFEFKQSAFLKGNRIFIVYDDDTIRGVYREGWCVFECCRSLADFEPSPRVHFFFDIPIFVIAVLAGIVAVGLGYVGSIANPHEGAHLVWYTIAGLLGACSALCFIVLRKKNQRVLVFPHESGNNLFDQIVLFWQKPSKGQFDEFVEILKTRITQAKLKRLEAQGQNVAQQLDNLVRMKEDGHLTLYEFEKAKFRIIGKEEKS